MDFTFDEAQSDVLELTTGLLDKRMADEPSQAPSGADWFDRELWRDLAESGLVGIALPERDGGSGAGFLEACVVLAELSRRSARVPFLEAAVLAAGAVARFGSDDLRTRVLPEFAAGDRLLTAAVSTEMSRPVTLTAVPVGQDWQLSGTVGHVRAADAASQVLVSAVDGDGHPGWFLVDLAASGLTGTPQTSVDRTGATHLRLDAVLVLAGDVVAAPGTADEVTAWLDQHAVVARSIAMLGATEAMVSSTAAYVTEREQFGRPVGSFQAVAHRVADAFLDATAIRLTAWRAAWLLANPTEHTESVERAIAIAAWWATDAPTRIADAAMHLHGGISVDLDYPLHRHYLAVRQGELALGGASRRRAALGEIHVKESTR